MNFPQGLKHVSKLCKIDREKEILEKLSYLTRIELAINKFVNLDFIL